MKIYLLHMKMVSFLMKIYLLHVKIYLLHMKISFFLMKINIFHLNLLPFIFISEKERLPFQIYYLCKNY